MIMNQLTRLVYYLMLLDSFIAARTIERITDPLYEDFYVLPHKEMHPLIVEISKDPLFLRLDNIFQLSLIKTWSAHGNITRGAHSRGTRKMAEIYINILNKNSRKEECIDEIQSLAIQVAALLHDVGHGPFSHLFQHSISSIVKDWTHEYQSGRIVKHLMKKYDLVKKYDLPTDFPDAVCDMIKGISREDHKLKYSNSVNFNRFVFFTIVNGDYESSLDVDKFDYMRRDSFSNCRQKYFNLVSDNILGIMKNSKIENDRIIYSERAIKYLVSFAHFVYMNYRFIYNHPETVGMDILFGDLIDKSSNDVKNIMKEYIEDLNKFSFMDDNFLMNLLEEDTNSETPKIISRIKVKDTYEMIGFIDIEYENISNSKDKVLVDRIEKNLIEQGMSPDDYIIKVFTFCRIVKRKTGNWDILKTMEFYSQDNVVSYYNFSNPLQSSDLWNVHCKYLKDYPLNISLLFEPKSYIHNIYNEYENSMKLQRGTVQVRLYSKTEESDKILIMRKAFERLCKI